MCSLGFGAHHGQLKGGGGGRAATGVGAGKLLTLGHVDLQQRFSSCRFQLSHCTWCSGKLQWQEFYHYTPRSPVL